MAARWTWILALVALCACQSPPAAPPTVVVRSDATLLAQRIHLPDGIRSVRWSVVPLGTPGGAAPGPTDTRLYAFLQPAAAANLTPLPVDQVNAPASIPPGIAGSLIPVDVLTSLQTDAAGQVLLPGERYDPGMFDRSPYRGVFAVRLGDGLLVCLQTS